MRRGLRSATFIVLGLTVIVMVVGALVVVRGLNDALATGGIEAEAARAVRRTLALYLGAIALIALTIAYIAARALRRGLIDTRAAILARAHGDDRTPLPAFAVAELADVIGAAERLYSRVGARESDLAREKAEVSIVLEAVSEGILRLDPRGRVLRANTAARGLLGIGDRSIGQPVATLVRHAQLRRILETAAQGLVQAAEITLDERRLLVSARPLGPEEGGGAVAAFVDLTEIRRLESVRRDFVANVSHELKTPLTSIRGYVETLLADAGMPDEMRRHFLEVVQRNADRLHYIVDDLLDLSRLESGGWRPDMHEVNALEVIEDVWSAVSERAGERRIVFQPPAEPVEVYADPGGLRQVLANLLDNALRYTPDGGRIQISTVIVPGAANGSGPPRDTILFEVRDTGAGIPSDALHRIFERFYRVDPARSRAEGGTGLGLSIVKHLVESMGGEVAAESELGKGTVIRFRLPAAS